MADEIKTIVVQGESVGGEAQEPRGLDVAEMPFEALAAYWLSLKRLSDEKRSRKVLEDEAAAAEEPTVRHLLQLSLSSLPDDAVRRLAEGRRATALTSWRRRLETMSVGVKSLMDAENPRVSLIRMLECWGAPPVGEKKAVELAQSMLVALKERASDREVLLSVDGRTPPDRLVVKLLFYVMWCRREGRGEVRDLLRYARCRYLLEGMSLVVDGFDRRFVSRHLDARRRELLADARRKLDMCLELSLLLRGKYAYADLFQAASSWLL